VLKTFWVNPHTKRTSTNDESDCHDDEKDHEADIPDKTAQSNIFDSKEDRLVDWIVGVLEENIKKVVARRQAMPKQHSHAKATYEPSAGKIPLDEAQDKITLFKFDVKAAMKESHFSTIELSDEVTSQLRNYVVEISSTHSRANPFHNFEHACHVTMSVVKLLKRIATPDIDVDKYKKSDLVEKLHDYTYGITTDPLAFLAIIFSALIHDVDHRGVSNAQLMKEEPEMASNYRDKSIAEQNSLDVAWDVLMLHKYSDLRNCLFGDQQEIQHFRQLIVNVVLATDIFDKELNALRKDRWNRAFSQQDNNGQTVEEDKDLKANIVMEHIIQASDVAHTMQHWHIYRKWNERLFRELSLAYKNGRMGVDPATFWYKGELGFFDNYIIPLAKKLKDCGVFGVSSDEYLNYALMNRAEWTEKGEAIVEKLVEGLEISED
jgi:hypothetical protein